MNNCTCISACNWDELHGKTLTIRVCEDKGNDVDLSCKVVCGHDPVEDVVYILAVEYGKRE